MRGGKTALYETLKRRILTLDLAPDQNLDEVGLSEEYGIFRTPVRDVFRQLAGEGYLEIRENRGARVIPMDHATMRDFFLVAPMIYQAVGRLVVQNFKLGQMTELKACQERFRDAAGDGDPEAMVVHNSRFHAIIGEMANSVFLKPTLNRLLIDHARIGHTFFRPTDPSMAANLERSCGHHDAMIAAISNRDEAAMIRLVFDHWELSRGNMELFLAPRSMVLDPGHGVAPVGRRRRAASAPQGEK